MTEAAGYSDWPRERVEATAERICAPAVLGGLLEAGQDAEAAAVQDVLQQAASGRGLDLPQAALLLQVQEPALREAVLRAAQRLHQKTFGGRVSLITPLCPTNRCVNDCLYCPLRRSNQRLHRTASTAREIQRDMFGLLDEGYRQVMLVFGEDRSGVHFVRDMIWAAYGARSGLRRVQRLDLNLNPMRMDELRELRETACLGTYHVFQETYDPAVYARLHVSGPKADYAWRLTCHDRAYEAGVTDVALGVLLGAGDFRFDVLAGLAHAQHLAATFVRGPRAINYPRMIPAPAAPASQEPGRQVSDEDFQFIVAVTRLAAPQMDIILSTTASAELRRSLYGLGVSEVSVGTASYPGTYTADGDPGAGGALNIGRPRGLEELVYRMCEGGFLPSFCGACVTPGAPAADMSPADRSAANALLALREYLLDHASAETQNVGGRLIQHKLAALPEKLRAHTLDLMAEAEAGLRRQVI
jgi:2-iminoacetate synthase